MTVSLVKNWLSLVSSSDTVNVKLAMTIINLENMRAKDGEGKPCSILDCDNLWRRNGNFVFVSEKRCYGYAFGYHYFISFFKFGKHEFVVTVVGEKKQLSVYKIVSCKQKKII